MNLFRSTQSAKYKEFEQWFFTRINGKSPNWVRKAIDSAGLVSKHTLGRELKNNPLTDYLVEVRKVGILKRILCLFTGMGIFGYKIIIKSKSCKKIRLEIYTAIIGEAQERLEFAFLQVEYDRVLDELHKQGYSQDDFETFLSERKRFANSEYSGVNLLADLEESERVPVLNKMKEKFLVWIKEDDN